MDGHRMMSETIARASPGSEEFIAWRRRVVQPLRKTYHAGRVMLDDALLVRARNIGHATIFLIASLQGDPKGDRMIWLQAEVEAVLVRGRWSANSRALVEVFDVLRQGVLTEHRGRELARFVVQERCEIWIGLININQ